MHEIKRILCPVDFSDASERALLYATGLARWHDGSIEALFVRPPVLSMWSEPATLDPATAEPVPDEVFLTRLQSFTSYAREVGVPVEAVVAAGDPTREVLRYIETRRPDLVAMGTHGRRGIERLILGSVTDAVIRHSLAPVLTVYQPQRPGPFGEPPFHRILCPVDFSPASLHALEQAVAFARRAGAVLTALHVLPAGSGAIRAEAEPHQGSADAERAARDGLWAVLPRNARPSLDVRVRVRRGAAAEEILKAVSNGGADLVIMGVHGRSAVEVMLFGSTTHRVVRHADCPVLTVGAGDVSAHREKDVTHGPEVAHF